MKVKQNLAFRVWIPFVLVAVVASVVFAWFFSRNQSVTYRSQQLRELKVVANSLSSSVAVLLREKDTLAIEDLLRTTSGKVGFTAAIDRKSTRLNSSHIPLSRMPSSA